MCLNTEKCAFGVGSSKILGNLITDQGIEINLDQINAVKHLKPPSNLKEVQILTRMLAAPNRFISKFADRCRPFYQLLKKWKGFQWNEECDTAFRDLKDYLMQAPMLTAPPAGGGFIHVPFSVRTCRERCVAKGPRSAVTYVLHQQDFG